MPLEPFTWQTVNVIADCVRVIHVDAGYFTSAGASVETELRELSTVDGVARLFVAESELSQTSRTSGAVAVEQTVVCEGYIPAHKRDAEQTAHTLRADVLRALGRITGATFVALPISMGLVHKFDIGPDCAIKRRIDGLDYVVVQVSVKLSCTLYS